MKKILEVKNIFKVYPDGVIANRDICMDVEENTIHALVGENGAGKSTLMKILFGLTPAQGGEIIYRGKPVQFSNPREAIASGIGMVHQHLMLAPDLTVAENMVLGVEPRKRKLFLNNSEAIKITKKVSEEFGLNVPAEKKIRDLPIGVRQRVEILKALYRNAELLILDEPTAVLTPQETEVLFKTLDGLKASGKTILFISHKLSEVTRIADRVTVMRDARVITTEPITNLTEEKIAHLMVGRDIRTERFAPAKKVGDVKLSVKDLRYSDEEGYEVLKGINFDIRAGEIVGLAGVEGNGQSELISAITGLLEPSSGEVILDGASLLNLTPRLVREKGVAHIPEDRMENGVAETTSLEENFLVDRYYKEGFSKRGRLDWKYIGEHSRDLIKKFNVLTKSSKTSVGSLSGGNIQKVVVARELTSNPQIIVAAQPTRGVDIGSEELIHSLLIQARDEGKAVFLISADLDEVLKLAGRIVVIYDGEITAHFEDVSKVTDMELGPYMLGVKKEENASGKIHS
ncbi:MAG: ABC transporter ATP-binding protein [Spirochaetales bacterium]|nr:ABC transporter ATP-binding protein [Spirochaetales bacterium]